MLDRDTTIALAKRMLALYEGGTTEQADEVYHVPTADYIDARRWQLEMDRIFRRVPLPLALTCELREPNSYKAMDALGVPVLITRGPDGRALAFVNACRHRGSIVVPDGCGEARRFTCPYHGWVYDRVRQPERVVRQRDLRRDRPRAVGAHAAGVRGAGRLRVRHVSPGPGMDIDDWLGDYAAELATLELDTWHVYDETRAAEPRVEGRVRRLPRGLSLLDAPQEHDLQGQHEQPDGGGRLWAAPAHHVRQAHAARPYATKTRRSGGQQSTSDRCTPSSRACRWPGAWRDTALVSQLFPGPTPDRSRTTQTFITRHPVVTAEERERAEQAIDFLFTVVRDEDYATGFGITRTLMSGANQEFVFGRNEPSLHHFHRWVDRLLAT